MNKMMKNLVIFLLVVIFSASLNVNAQVPGAIVNPSASMVRPNPSTNMKNKGNSASKSTSGGIRGGEPTTVSALKGNTVDGTVSYSDSKVPVFNNQANTNAAMMMNSDSIPVDNNQFVYDEIIPQENFNQQYTIPNYNNENMNNNQYQYQQQSNNEYSNNTAFGAGAFTGALVMGSVAVFLNRKASDDSNISSNNKASLKKTPTAARNIRNNRLATPLMATDGDDAQSGVDQTMDNLNKIGAEEPKMDTEVEDVPVKPKAPLAAKWIPGKTAPDYLDGTFAGDVGFDPLGFGKNDIKAMRDAELKHGRIAMLAAAGWPVSELWHKTLADTLHLNNQLGDNGMTPSILNGFGSNPAFLAGAYLMAAGIGSFFEMSDKKVNPENPADKGFDPWGLKNMRSDSGLYKNDKEGQFAMELAEVKHGRLAMLAITSFIMQELVTKIPVVEQTPQFF